ncbi:MAG TPA: HAD hydrolase family protein [Candidatus Eisenbacteria bacterium]|nr:HAD hydrolase family protein [Candidatus Eisenbacteria bacterium]
MRDEARALPAGARADAGEARPPGPSAPAATPASTPERVVERLLRQTPGVSPEATPAPDPRELLPEPIPGPIRVLFLDVDGTLTDGFIVEQPHGDARHFWVRDGLAMQWARDLGVAVVAISGRRSNSVQQRMTDLGIECHVGVQDKVAVAGQVLARVGATWADAVMVGDDLPDVALMKRVAWPIAVADAQREVRTVARTVTGAPGGRGAVREVIEMILKHNGTWPQVLARYEAT